MSASDLNPIDASPADACRAYRKQFTANRLSGSRIVPIVVAPVKLTEQQKRYPGVSRHRHFDRDKVLWVARIKVSQRSLFLGDFETPELASAAYQGAKRALKLMHGKRSVTVSMIKAH